MTHFADLLRHWSQRPGEPMALATIVRTEGSTYRRAGARMLISATCETMGILSGGCLEADLAERAQRPMVTGEAEMVTYDTRRLLGCHGKLEILLESGPGLFFQAAQEAQRDRQVLVGTTVFAAADRAVRLGSYPVATGSGLRFATDHPALATDLEEAWQWEAPQLRSYVQEGGTMHALWQQIRPPLRVVIAGAGPDVTPLAMFAEQLGWEVTVVVHPTQTPPMLSARAQICFSTPEALAENVSLDGETAVVLMSHHYGRDLTALAALWPREIGYLGLLGPKRRREQLLGDLAAEGVDLTPERLQRLHSPAGLDLGADGPEEIALSIVAEIKAAWSGRRAGFLREARGSIHATRLHAVAA